MTANFPEILTFLRGLCNLPDLILIAFLLFSTVMGATRGPVRTLIAFVVRLVSLIVSFFTARALAPPIARGLVTPILGDVFEKKAALVPGALQAQITETAVKMAEGITFLMLLFLCTFGLSVACHLIGRTLRVLGKLPVVSTVGRLGGMGIGLVGGVLMAVLALWLIGVFRPDVYAGYGYLSPTNLEKTTLVRTLLTLFPVMPR